MNKNTLIGLKTVCFTSLVIFLVLIIYSSYHENYENTGIWIAFSMIIFTISGGLIVLSRGEITIS